MHPMRPPYVRLGFTLVELLVVVSIVVLLLAILIPTLGKARYQATNLLCLNRQRQLTFATLYYCTDNRGLFPDRGIDSTAGGEPMWARWAMRRVVGGGPTLDDMLDDYIAEDNLTWVCPLYKSGPWPYGGTDRCPTGRGGKYGCPDHGISHNGNPALDYITFSFHAGLKEKSFGGYTWNPGDRRRLGEPYVVKQADDTVVETSLLFSDTAGGDNGWTPTLYTSSLTGRITNKAPWSPGLTTNHAPPPGTRWQYTSVNSWYGVLAIEGETLTNWTYDDGSAVTHPIDTATAWGSNKWIKVGLGGRHALFPNDR